VSEQFIKLDLHNIDMSQLGISKTASRRILKKVGNNFIKGMRASVPDAISKQDKILKTGFKRVRSHSKLISAKSGRGRLWFGGNDIQARFGKGRFYKTSQGAGKGFFFKKGAFIATMKNSGKRALWERNGKTTRYGRRAIVQVEREIDMYRVVGIHYKKYAQALEEDLFREVKHETDR